MIESYSTTYYYIKCDKCKDAFYEEEDENTHYMKESAAVYGWTFSSLEDEWYCPECSRGDKVNE